MRTIRFVLACVAVILATSGHVRAGWLTTGSHFTEVGTLNENNLIVQGFNLDDSTSESFLDSFDFGVYMRAPDTLYGVLLEIQAGSAQIIERTNVGSVTLDEGLHLASFNVNQSLDVTKTYAVGVYAQSSYGHYWQITDGKSVDPQWVNHTFYYPAPSVGLGYLPYVGSGHDWEFDSVTTLHLSSVSAVPEPTSVTLWSMGLAGMTLIRLRRRKSAS